jgi:hypothetical protein
MSLGGDGAKTPGRTPGPPSPDPPAPSRATSISAFAELVVGRTLGVPGAIGPSHANRPPELIARPRGNLAEHLVGR